MICPYASYPLLHYSGMLAYGCSMDLGYAPTPRPVSKLTGSVEYEVLPPTLCSYDMLLRYTPTLTLCSYAMILQLPYAPILCSYTYSMILH
eukprot:739088-Rhodomonas_salina.3